MARTGQKKLNVLITVDASAARTTVAKFMRDLRRGFRMLQAPVFGDMSKQMEKIQAQMKQVMAINAGTGGTGNPPAAAMAESIKTASKQMSSNWDQLNTLQRRNIQKWGRLSAQEIRQAVAKFETEVQRSFKSGGWVPGVLSGKSAAESSKVFKQYDKIAAAQQKQIEQAKVSADKYYQTVRAQESKYRQEVEKTAMARKKAYALISTAGVGGRPIEMTKASYVEEVRKAQKYQEDYVKGWENFAVAHNKTAGALEKQWSHLAELTGKSAASLQRSIHPKDLPMAITQMEKYHMLVKQFGETEVKTALAAGTMTTKFKEMGGQMTDVERGVLGLNREFIKTHGLVKTIPLGKFKAFLGEVKQFAIFQMRWFAGAGLLFGMIGIVRSLVSTALTFSQTLKDIQAVTGATARQINMISESAKNIANTTPMAAEEAAKLGLQLIRAGIEAEDAAAAMNVAAKVAVVSGEDAKTVADTVATAMMAWKLTGKEATMVGNTIAASMNFSRLQVEDLGTAFNYLAGVASTFNWSFQETNAVLATYSNLGVRASTISTGLVQLLSEFVAPSAKARKELERLQINIEDLNPVTHKYSEILKTLEKAGFNSAKALDIFQTRAGRSLMFALRAGSEEFEKMEKKIRESKQLTEGLQKVMEGPIAAFKHFWNIVKTSAILIGDELTPTIRILGDTFSVLASTMYHVIHLFTTTYGKMVILSAIAWILYKRLMLIGAGAAWKWVTGVAMGMKAMTIAFYNAATGATTFAFALATIKKLNPLVWVITTALGLAGMALLDRFISKTDKSISGLMDMQKQLENNQTEIKAFGRDMEDSLRDVDVAIREFNASLEEIDLVNLSDAIDEVIEYGKQFDESRKKIEATSVALQELIRVNDEWNKTAEKTKEIGPITPMSGPIRDVSMMNLEFPHESSSEQLPGMGRAYEFGEYLKTLTDLKDFYRVYASFGPIIEGNTYLIDTFTKVLHEHGIELDMVRVMAERYAKTEGDLLRQQREQAKAIENTIVPVSELLGAVDEQTHTKMTWAETRAAYLSQYEEVMKRMQKTTDQALRAKMVGTMKTIFEKLVKGAKDNLKDFKGAILDAMTMNETDYAKVEREASEARKAIQEAYLGLSDADKARYGKQYANALKSIDMNLFKERSEISKKEFERQKKFYEEIDKMASEMSGRELERKLDEVDTWGREHLAMALALDDWSAYFRIVDLVLKKKRELRAEDALAREEAGITFGLGQIDLARQGRQITEAQAVTQKLALNERLLEIHQRTLATKTQESDAWYDELEAIRQIQEEILNLTDRLRELNGSMEEGILEGLRKYIDEMPKTFEMGVNLALETARAMESGFETFFFDAMKGELKSLEDYWRSFANAVMAEIAKIAAAKTAAGLINTVLGVVGAVAGAAGGLSAPSGGAAFQPGAPFMPTLDVDIAGAFAGLHHSGGFIERYHTGGLAHDEVPAILQTGEYVVSRRGVKTLDRINRGEVSDQPTIVNHTHITVQAFDRHDVQRFIEKHRESFGGVAGSLAHDNYPSRRMRR